MCVCVERDAFHSLIASKRGTKKKNCVLLSLQEHSRLNRTGGLEILLRNRKLIKPES